MMLLVIRPAPTSSAQDSATSPTPPFLGDPSSRLVQIELLTKVRQLDQHREVRPGNDLDLARIEEG